MKCTDEAMFIFLERKSFQGFDPNKLTLLYPSCRASYNDTHISLRTSLNDCGTTHNESEDAVTFYNKVRSVQSYSAGNIITREQNVSIPFYCSYGRKAMLRNPSFKTWKNYFTASEGNLCSKMFFCLFLCLSACLLVCLFTHLLVCLFAHLLVCLFACLFLFMLICLLACLFACLFVCLLLIRNELVISA